MELFGIGATCRILGVRCRRIGFSYGDHRRIHSRHREIFEKVDFERTSRENFTKDLLPLGSLYVVRT